MRATAQGSDCQTIAEESASSAGAEKHVEPEFRFEERAQDLAGGAIVRSQTRGIVVIIRRQWREGKVRPIPGSSPHDRLVGRVISSSLKERLRRSLPRHCFPPLHRILGAQYAFLRHVGIYLVRCGFKTKPKTPGWDRAASRWSAPSPGSRACREDHAPSHRPQMSSDRLFLDRVARQHCPSLLHRHAQTTTHLSPALAKQDISTLQRIGHFYFALTGAGAGGREFTGTFGAARRFFKESLDSGLAVVPTPPPSRAQYPRKRKPASPCRPRLPGPGSRQVEWHRKREGDGGR